MARWQDVCSLTRVTRSTIWCSKRRCCSDSCDELVTTSIILSTCASTKYNFNTSSTFNGPFSGTTRVSRYQKGKTNLDFTEARDSEWQWHQLGRMQVCTSLQTDNHTSTPPLSFLQVGCPSCHPTNSVKALKARYLWKFETRCISYTFHVKLKYVSALPRKRWKLQL